MDTLIGLCEGFSKVLAYILVFYWGSMSILNMAVNFSQKVSL